MKYFQDDFKFKNPHAFNKVNLTDQLYTKIYTQTKRKLYYSLVKNLYIKMNNSVGYISN